MSEVTVTRISDLNINPGFFSHGVNLESLRVDALVQSRAVIHDPSLDAFLNNPNGGNTITIRHLNPLGEGVVPNVSSDDPAEVSSPNKVSDVKTVAVRQSLNVSFSEMDYAVTQYGIDPVNTLQYQTVKYWNSVRQDRILSTIQGLLSDSIVNHGGDLLVDLVGPETTENYEIPATAANFINPNAIIMAAAKMGDRMKELKGIMVHSTVYATMQQLNMIEQMRLSENDIMIDTFMGFPVITDDSLTVVPVPAGTTEGHLYDAFNIYYSYLFGEEAFVIGTGNPVTPFEVKREPDLGNGSGRETIFHRVEWIIHPQGYQYNLSANPTVAQLEAATSWTRAWPRKRIKLSVIKSRG
jgi:hypothetical protein